MPTATLSQARQLLQEHFGYATFHPGQESLIEQLLAGRDVLGIMPTGAGKSICYQIPALALPGLTVVISPLISLMKDQVDGLRRMGIGAAFLNSSQSAREANETYAALRRGEVKLLYIAPERMEAEGFADYLSGLQVSLVAVDEAHCISQWGHDFRPSYQRIHQLIASFPTRPTVGAFTATATARVKEDILSQLALREPFTLTTGFDRANLYFAVHAPAERTRFVLDYLRENRGESGILYCLTRKQVEKLTAELNRAGIKALPYHAGLEDQERKANQDAFRDDAVEVIVATNAFGMGIDKSNVRFVIHYGMPKTLENYYQEAGRAGRDGEKADCLLLYSAQDIITNRFLIDRAAEQGGTEQNRDEDYRKLQEMVDYCNGDGCLRAYILRYFGMEEVSEHCDNCLNCGYAGEATDITVEAQKIISCVQRMGNRFGAQLVTQVLRGANTQKIRQFNLQELSTYGLMKDYPEKTVKEIISYLVARGYLEMRGGEYPVLAVGGKAQRFLREGQPLMLKRAIRVAEPKNSKLPPAQAPLFELLRGLRRELATSQGVAPYLVFSDATLLEMCARLPQDQAQMQLISGVGRFKLEQYGEDFLSAIRQFVVENEISLSTPEAPAETSPWTSPASPTPKEATGPAETVIATHTLYRQGLSVEEIAAERELTIQTVENHLIKAHQSGLHVDLESFIPAQYREAIFAAIAEQGTERLRPIKEALPEAVSYRAIRFAVAQYEDGPPACE